MRLSGLWTCVLMVKGTLSFLSLPDKAACSWWGPPRPSQTKLIIPSFLFPQDFVNTVSTNWKRIVLHQFWGLFISLSLSLHETNFLECWSCHGFLTTSSASQPALRLLCKESTVGSTSELWSAAPSWQSTQYGDWVKGCWTHSYVMLRGNNSTLKGLYVSWWLFF